MKKVRVNAEVKAMVSLIEAFINITYLVVIKFTVRTSFGTLMIQTSMYLIILPYFSLMNTSYNKDRIIENGWKTLFKNLWIKNGSNRDLMDQVPSAITTIDIQNKMNDQTKPQKPSSKAKKQSQQEEQKQQHNFFASCTDDIGI